MAALSLEEGQGDAFLHYFTIKEVAQPQQLGWISKQEGDSFPLRTYSWVDRKEDTGVGEWKENSG